MLNSSNKQDFHIATSSRVLVSSFAQDELFCLQGEGPVVSSANSISFKRTLCTINADDGRYLFTESSTIETGLLDQTTLFLSAADRGKTKDVYGASYILVVFSHKVRLICGQQIIIEVA